MSEATRFGGSCNPGMKYGFMTTSLRDIVLRCPKTDSFRDHFLTPSA